MPIALFNFVRALKISRFTIDVLMQRLEQLNEGERCVGLMHESVASCERLHNRLCARMSGLQDLDDYAMASLNAEFGELQHNISESIARLKSFELGARKAREF